MQKDELISITNSMCKQLLETIDNHQSATKDEIADFLIESAQLIMNVDEKDLGDISFAELLFSNAYKDLAKKSLSSYQDTGLHIDELTKMHEHAIDKCHDKVVDLPLITAEFDEIHIHLKEEVAKANEIIIQLTNQVKELERKSNLDSLTRVYNRRALSSHLDHICSNNTKTNDSHIILMDIDDFKYINDTYGHIAGDKVLIYTAHIIKKTLRDGDKVFRYGGEEFLIVLNRLDDEQCQTIAQRLLELIGQNKLLYKNQRLRVTVSIGTTRFAESDTPTSLISRADKALYEAKNSGKNKICVVNK